MPLLARSGATAAALPGFAQKAGKVWRIGFLGDAVQSHHAVSLERFSIAMREIGYAEGRDYSMELRFAQNDLSRLPELARALVALKVDLILVSSTSSAYAAQKVSRATPIVAFSIGDPVGSGLAASLSRPGGNVTGLTTINTELISKRLDLLRQILPGMRRAAFLYNPDNPNDVLGFKRFEQDCAQSRLTAVRAHVREAEDIPAAFQQLLRDKADGYVASGSSSNIAWRKIIIEHAAKNRLPGVYSNVVWAESGGLAAYSTDVRELHRRAAIYVDKIFKGAKPGELPFEQPTKFEFVVNLRTAKALGITLPPAILVQATRTIE